MRVASANPSNAGFIGPGKADGEVARIEAQLAGVPLDTPAYLRRFIVELVLLQPLSRASAKLLTYTFKNKNLSPDEQVYLDGLMSRAGRTQPLLVSAMNMLGIASVGVVFSQLLGSICQYDFPKYLYAIPVLAVMLLGDYFACRLYKRRLTHTIAVQLRQSGLAELISFGPNELLLIFDNAIEPWRTMFLGIRPKTLQGTVRLIAANLLWYCSPPRRFIPLGWLPRLCLGLFGLAAMIFIFGSYGHILYSYTSSGYSSPGPSSGIPLSWPYVVLSILALLAVTPVKLMDIRDVALKSELTKYLREHLTGHADEAAPTPAGNLPG
jgi:hypothetical protein